MGAKTRRFGIVLPPMLSGRFRRVVSSEIADAGVAVMMNGALGRKGQVTGFRVQVPVDFCSHY
jgi:hypothetical protein